MEVTERRLDGTYVATVNGLPYHVIQSDPLFAEAQAAGANAPLEVAPAAPTLSEKRDQAFLERDDFLLACQAAGLISESDAETAADGTWPPSFNAFISSLPLAERVRAKKTFSVERRIWRNDALLGQIADAQTVSDAGLDALFGIS